MPPRFHSQLRRDLVSGDWIVIAPGRGKRPHEVGRTTPRVRASRLTCPFEDPEATTGRQAILKYGEGRGWFLQVIENKFPAFVHRGYCTSFLNDGPYTVAEGVGHHDLVVTKDHHKDFPALSDKEALQVFRAFRDRYLMFLNDECLAYASVFHNWGPGAGASIYHPHYQLIAIPVIPPDIEHSLEGSRRFFRREGTCVHCRMLQWELKKKTRVVYENKGAVVIAPFVSRAPFEMRVFPKAHLPYFEDSYDHHFEYVVEALQECLRRITKLLRDPDYNFFVHTAPIEKKSRYGHYHWHIEVLPKLNIFAGFELSTGLEINPVDPNDAARILRRRTV